MQHSENDLYSFCELLSSEDYIFCESSNVNDVDDWFVKTISQSFCSSNKNIITSNSDEERNHGDKISDNIIVSLSSGNSADKDSNLNAVLMSSCSGEVLAGTITPSTTVLSSNNPMKFGNISGSALCPSSSISISDDSSNPIKLLPVTTGLYTEEIDRLTCLETETRQQIYLDVQDSSPKKKRKLDDSVDIQLSTLNRRSNTRGDSAEKPLKREVDGQYETFNATKNISLVRENNLIQFENYFKDDDGDLPLHIAVAKQHLVSVEKIIELRKMNGWHLDTQNKRYQTALHLACYEVTSESIPIISILLQSGANPWVVDFEGNNILHIACNNGSIEVLCILVEYYTNNLDTIIEMMSVCNYEGLSPMHIAAKKKNMAVIDYLLQLGCNLDVKDMKSGATVPIYATRDADDVLARYFIEHGVEVKDVYHAHRKKQRGTKS